MYMWLKDHKNKSLIPIFLEFRIVWTVVVFRAFREGSRITQKLQKNASYKQKNGLSYFPVSLSKTPKFFLPAPLNVK